MIVLSVCLVVVCVCVCLVCVCVLCVNVFGASVEHSNCGFLLCACARDLITCTRSLDVYMCMCECVVRERTLVFL